MKRKGEYVLSGLFIRLELVVGDCEIVPAGQYVRLYVMEEHHGIGSFLSPKVVWIKLDLKPTSPQDITINQVE